MRARSDDVASFSAERAQSSVIGVVLVISITILGVTGVLLFGSSALEDAHRQSEVNAAEHAMTQLDSRFSLVALGSAERQASAVDLGGDATLRVDGDRGWVNVTIVNATSGDVNSTVLNTTLGAILYENDGTSIAYQGGGVWKKTPDGGSVMVSPPEFHYRTKSDQDPTLTLPLVVVRGEATLTGDATVEKDSTVSKYPAPGQANRTNPLTGGQVNVTVHSEYYEAWGAFFEERTGGDVTYDHDAKQVVITLVIQKSVPGVTGGVVSGAAGYTLTFGNSAEVDSYNSSKNDYATQNGQNTSIIAAGDVDMGQNSEIKGDLVTGGTLMFSGGSGQRVTGDLTYGGSPPSDPSRIEGEINSGADVDIPDSVGWLIDEREAEFRDPSDNDNGADNDISGTTLDCSDDCMLPAGNYYVDEIDLNGDTLTLDGDVEIYVDGDLTVDKNSEAIEVTGGGPAKIYLDDDFTLEKGEITVPGDKSPQMWVYMRPGREAYFHDSKFVGVIYGPGDGAQLGVDIKLHANNNRIFGGLVGTIPHTGTNAIAQGDAIHFDEALIGEDPLGSYANNQPEVTYMHVTVNRVNVSSR